MKTKRILIAIGILTAVLLVWAIAGGRKQKETAVSTSKAIVRDITEMVSASGKIQPVTEVKISADVSGEITELLVAEGDSVKAGQLLLRINPELYLTTLDQLQASLDNARAGLATSEAQTERARAALRQAELQYKRQKELFNQRVISAQEFENAETQYQLAKSDVESASKSALAASFNVRSVQARLEEGRKNLGRTSIYAPVNGVVSLLNNKKGERVVGTAQMAGTEIMRIANLETMEVQVDINENDIVRIRIGDSANVNVDAYTDRIFGGVVTDIANSAKFNAAQQASDQVTNYTVKVRITAAGNVAGSPVLKPGMTATVDIKTETVRKTVCVPISAVTTRNPAAATEKNKSDKKNGESTASEKEKESKGTWVFIPENGKAKAVAVKTGLQDTDWFQITEGLKEGDEVISAPVMVISRNLKDGDRIKTTAADKVFDKP
jgi:HlyD family secretion protein